MEPTLSPNDDDDDAHNDDDHDDDDDDNDNGDYHDDDDDNTIATAQQPMAKLPGGPPSDFTLSYAIPSYPTLFYAIPRYSALSYAVPRYPTLSFFVLSCPTLFYISLRYPTLSYSPTTLQIFPQRCEPRRLQQKDNTILRYLKLFSMHPTCNNAPELVEDLFATGSTSSHSSQQVPCLRAFRSRVLAQVSGFPPV